VANLKVEAEATAQAQILQLQDDAAKQSLDKAEQEAGQLFDALLSGSSKKISTEFQKVFEQIATAPIKKLFEVSMAAALKPLDDSLANAVKPYVTSISNWILGKKASPNPFDLNNPNNPYATPGGALSSIWAASSGQNGNVVNSGADPNNLLIMNWAKKLGIPRPGATGVPGGTAPVFQITDAQMTVQNLTISAQNVTITQTATAQQSPIPPSMDGDHPPTWFSGADSFSAMNLMPALGGAGAGLSLGPALAAIPSLAMSLQTGIQGINSLGQISQNSINTYGAVSNTGGPLGSNGQPSTSAMAGWMQAAAGGLMVYEASRHGGVGGALTGAIGGAELGSKIGSLLGPEGTLVGALIGGVGGLLTGVFGHKDRTAAFEAAVKTAGYNEQYHAPPPETFSFAEGSTFATNDGNYLLAGWHVVRQGSTAERDAVLDERDHSVRSRRKISTAQPSQAQLYNNLNNGLPFFGAPTYGLGPHTLMPPITQTNLPPGTHQTSVNFTLPPIIDRGATERC
jgi:hypothetical protein